MNLDEILTRKIIATCSWRGTAEEYRWIWGEAIPLLGVNLRKGNEVVCVEKDGKRAVEGLTAINVHESLIRANGTLFFVKFVCYELTDAEWDWAY